MHSTGQSYSFGYKLPTFLDTSRTLGPGPADYGFKGNMQTRKPKNSLIFSQTLRFTQKKDNYPGVGHYHTTLKDSHSIINLPTIGRGKRLDIIPKSIIGNPSPQQYNVIKNMLIKDKNFKFSENRNQRSFLEKVDRIPGPNEYDVLKEPQYIKRVEKKYKYVEYPSNQLKFSRMINKENLNFPGPGQYKIENNLNKGKQYSFTTDDKQKHNYLSVSKYENRPAPNTYNITDKSFEYLKNYKTNKNYKFSIAKRTFDDRKPDYFSPGPGQYTVNFLCTRGKTQSGKWDKTKKFFMFQQKIPGPGTYKNNLGFEQYKIKREKPKKIDTSIYRQKFRKRIQKTENSEHQEKIKQIEQRLYQRQSLQLDSSREAVSPNLPRGRYKYSLQSFQNKKISAPTIPLTKKSSIKFAQSQRKLEFLDVFNSPVNGSRSPGPQFYIEKSSQKQTFVKFNLAKKVTRLGKQTEIEFTPAPGAYDIEKSCFVKSKPTELKKNFVSQKRNYNSNESIESQKSQSNQQNELPNEEKKGNLKNKLKTDSQNQNK